jgi:hypothetical protein
VLPDSRTMFDGEVDQLGTRVGCQLDTLWGPFGMIGRRKYFAAGEMDARKQQNVGGLESRVTRRALPN